MFDYTFILKSKHRFKTYTPNWLPRLYCKYAATNRPVIVTGTNPKTRPDNSASTIDIILILNILIDSF